jgi:precorrin-4 methylase
MIMSNRATVSRHAWVLMAIMLSLLFFYSGNTLAHEEKSAQGKFYLIGTGPAGPEHATYRAIECIMEADVILCSDDMLERFSRYLKGKKLLGNPWKKGNFKYSWGDLEKLGPKEKKVFVAERFEFWDEMVRKIRSEMAKGKRVALLDSGDPCVFGPSHRIIEGFEEDEVEIIPGLGCFQAAMAALKKSSIPAYDTRFVMLTAPLLLYGRPENEDILRDLSKYPITMVFYMPINRAQRLIGRLKKYYPADLPAAVVYNAGYPEKEHVVKGRLNTILNEMKSQKERLGLLIVGRCLEGQPQRGTINYVAR